MHLSLKISILVICFPAAIIAADSEAARPGTPKLSLPPVSKPSISSLRMKYSKVSATNESGFAKVIQGEGETYAEGVIDATGREVIVPSTNLLVSAISGPTALVQKGRDFLFVNLERQRQDPSTLDRTRGYAFAEPYACGLALVQKDNRYLYLDPQGQPAFSARYDFAESFHQDRAFVILGDHKRIIDTRGKTVAELKYDQVNPQSPWCWQVTRIQGDKYLSGFVDLNGNAVTPLDYDEVGYYDAEVQRIRVGRADKYGFLDERARVVIPVQYEQAEIFAGGKARVMLKGRDFFIDPNGKEVAE